MKPIDLILILLVTLVFIGAVIFLTASALHGGPVAGTL